MRLRLISIFLNVDFKRWQKHKTWWPLCFTHNCKIIKTSSKILAWNKLDEPNEKQYYKRNFVWKRPYYFLFSMLQQFFVIIVKTELNNWRQILFLKPKFQINFIIRLTPEYILGETLLLIFFSATRQVI